MIGDHHHSIWYPMPSYCIGWFINFAMCSTYFALKRIIDPGMSMVFWPWLTNIYRNGKFGNQIEAWSLEFGVNIVYVCIPSSHSHAHLQTHTPIRLLIFHFTRLTMSQVKILGMFLFCWHRVSILDRHLGGTLCTRLFCKHGESLPWVHDKSWNQGDQHLQKS
jgi:hypothetical protein